MPRRDRVTVDLHIEAIQSTNRQIHVTKSLLGGSLFLLPCTALLAQSQNLVVEYQCKDSDQYFITGREGERAALDALADFKRTGMSFAPLATDGASSAERDSVCRYRIEVPPTQASTHFYGLSSDCALIACSN